MTDQGSVILVPIDLYGINRRNLETLVRIARQLDRGLLGLLLDDIRLQRVADLPFTTEITFSSGRERSLLRDHLTQRQSDVGNTTRKLLHELADHHRVAVSFEDASGNRWHTALERDGQRDIFFPPRQRWHVPEQSRHSATIKRLGILLAGSPTDDALINTAAALLRAGLVGDTYVLCQRSPLPEQLHALYQPGHQVRIQSHILCTPTGISALIQQSPYDLLLLTRDSLEGIASDQLDAALDKSGSQILVVH